MGWIPASAGMTGKNGGMPPKKTIDRIRLFVPIARMKNLMIAGI
jgi:hypothetical protein